MMGTVEMTPELKALLAFLTVAFATFAVAMLLESVRMLLHKRTVRLDRPQTLVLVQVAVTLDRRVAFGEPQYAGLEEVEAPFLRRLVPWKPGDTFAANITSHETGIGNWTEEQFRKAFTEGKSKGLEGTRPILPPMPWANYINIVDEDLKAIFAYLKSTNPVENAVPNPIPPGELNGPVE